MTTRPSSPFESLGGRKFIFAMWVTVAATALIAFDKISDGVYSTIIIAALGGYLVGNVAQKQVLKDSE